MPVKIVRLTTLNIASLPAPWPRIFNSAHQMPLWIFLTIEGSNIRYFAHEPENANSRSTVVIASIHELVMTDKSSVPDGNYLINIGDIYRDDYPCPVLSFTAKQSQVDAGKVVLIPDSRALKGHDKRFARLDAVMRQHPWEQRKNQIFWRGMATGGSLATTNFEQVKRLSFLHAVRDLKFVDAGITEYPKSLNPQLVAKFHQQFPLANFVPLEKSLAYKYQMDIDGHSCSFDRMAWILYSNSVLFKHKSDEVQWYYPKMQPWTHYVPVNVDFSNLVDQYHWVEQHPQQAQNIASNARKFAEVTFKHDAILQALSTGMREYQSALERMKN